MTVDNIKLKDLTPNGFAFSEPEINDVFEFDFANDWIINPDNAEGISIENNVITITKVKPNTWFMRSDYGFTTAAERNEKFFDKSWILSGVANANNEGLFGSGCGCGYWSFNYYAYGFLVAPIRKSDNLMLSYSYPWDMGVGGGAFKNPNYGAALFGYRVDGNLKCWNNGNVGYNDYSEGGLVIYSSGGDLLDGDGYLNFSTPITISCLRLSQVIDPTTKEAFTIALGDTVIYEKERTFENLLVNHELAFNLNGWYDEGTQTNGNEIHGENIYLVSSRRFGGGIYKNSGLPISIPVPVDFSDLLKRETVRFACKQTDPNKESGLWYNVIKHYKENDIKWQYGAEYLFANSNINNESYDKDDYIDVRISVDGAVIDSCFDWCGASRGVGPKKVRFIVNGGSITKARNVFRQNKYNLEEVQFINNAKPGQHVCPNMFSGMFELCGLSKFPEGLGFDNGEFLGESSEGTCYINFIAHDCAFEVFGNYKPDGSRYELLVDPACMQAFDTRNSPNDGPANRLKEIIVDLNMKFVDPQAGGNAQYVFYCTNLQKAKIMNLNKGVWVLDGDESRGLVCNGNLLSLDEESVNYLISNVFDLNYNSNTENVDKSEYTEGFFKSSIYLPESLKDIATTESLNIAKERGWDIYFGGVLGN